jgi:transcriptional regulator with PAS, ATPase and Fis domain
MKSDLNDLKKLTLDLIKNGTEDELNEQNQNLFEKLYGKKTSVSSDDHPLESVTALPAETPQISKIPTEDKYSYAETIEEEETLSLHEKELEMIKQALVRSKGKRKLAAQELGISERTLYRKIKQFDLNDLE